MPKGEMPMSCNFFSRISRFMVSNALLISDNTTAATFFLSMPLTMVSVVRISEVFVERSFLLPLWVVDYLLFDSR